jgi:hypothetical protein
VMLIAGDVKCPKTYYLFNVRKGRVTFSYSS